MNLKIVESQNKIAYLEVHEALDSTPVSMDEKLQTLHLIPETNVKVARKSKIHWNDDTIG